MKAGTTVTWVNHDDIPHSIVCPDLKVQSHPLDTDDTFSYKFEQPGTYDYICGLHPHMHGQVVAFLNLDETVGVEGPGRCTLS